MKNRLIVFVSMAAMLAMLTGCVGYSRHTVTKNEDGTCSENYSNAQVGMQLPNRAPKCSCKVAVRGVAMQPQPHVCPQAYYPAQQQVGNAHPASYSTAPSVQMQRREVQVYYFKGDTRPYELHIVNGKKEYRLREGPVYRNPY